jgi:hypothetical protein
MRSSLHSVLHHTNWEFLKLHMAAAYKNQSSQCGKWKKSLEHGGKHGSGAPAPVHLHIWKLAEDDVFVLVHVEHVDPAHLLRRAARAAVGLLQEVRPRVRRHHHPERAVARAVVSFVLGRVDDPLPVELLLKVDGEGPEAAVCLCRVGRLGADLVQGALAAVVECRLPNVQLQERGLNRK